VLENRSGAHRTASIRASADAERLLVLLERLLAELLHARLAEPLLAEALLPEALLALLLAEALLALLLALLLDQRRDGDRQRLLYGLLHRLPDPVVQGVVQRHGQVRVRLLPQALLVDLLELLDGVLQALRDLLARLLAGLLDRLLHDLGDLLLAHLGLRLLLGLGASHHRHGSST
jgi:hypothetical protein